MKKSGNTPQRTLWRRSVAVAVALAISSTALAQSNAVGSIFGAGGEAGAKVTITNTATGVTRSTTVDSSGRFQIPSLPVGNYKVELQKASGAVETRNSVLVAIGSGSEVSFGDEVLEEALVSATGTSLIDVSSTDTRTVFTSEELGKMSVKQSIEELAMLAPGAVRGDARYNTNRGQPAVSFSGSGANENAFYINGYAVTDPTKGLGSSSLPYGSIAQYQLITGGYGAEFGRSTGGVVNIVTKSGSNKWVAGAQVTYTADELSDHSPDYYVPANGTPQDGLLYSDASERETNSTVYNLYVGGPIIQDKLFFYLSGEFEKRTIDGPQTLCADTYRNRCTNDGLSGWHDRDIEVPRWLAKVDYNFAEGQLLELTAISDVRKEKRRYYAYYNNVLPNATLQASQGVSELRTKGTNINGGFDYKDGGELYIAKYTGTITDNLIFTGLYGHQKNAHGIVPFGYDPTVVAVRDNRTTIPAASKLPTIGAYTTLNDPTSYDKTTGYRFDLNWIVEDHSIRVGYDFQDLAYKDGVVTSGPGYFWQYFDVQVPGSVIQGSGGAVSPASGQYVTKVMTDRGGTFTTDQYAYYLEDRWQLSNNVLLTLGLRNENFKNYNAEGVLFLDQTNQWAPRLGLSWDVFGDSSLRTFANAGRYHLAIPLNVAFRQVGRTLGTSEYFSFTSIDANGIPQGLAPLGNGPYSSNQEYGQARDPKQAAAQNLKPYYQDEFSVGAEGRVFNDLKAGVRLTYRSLKSQIDDNCDWRPAYNWAMANGYSSGVDNEEIIAPGLDDLAETFGNELWGCKIINPGEDNTILFSDGNGNYIPAKISAEQFGLPKLKRTYKGMDLFLEHPFRNGWYGKIDYTLSYNKGNAEGMLYSDSGQPDVAVTANWDSPELMDGAYGYLPNDRRHQIKAFGFYELSPEWRVSATVTSASGRPRSLAGTYAGDALLDVDAIGPDALTPAEYHDGYVIYNGPYYHWVNGERSPRGAGGRLSWTTLVDVGLMYSPNAFKNQLKVGVDVFNVFNTVEVQSSVDQVRLANNVINPNGNMALSYNTGRQVRLMLRYDWE